MTRICENPACSREFQSDNVRRKYCCHECGRHVSAKLTAKANRRRMLAAAPTYAVAGTGLSIHNPVISSAEAEWWLRSIYSQPHPLGASERN